MQQLGSLRHQCTALLDVRGAVVIHTRRLKERARQSKPKHHEGCRPQIITRGSQTAAFVIDVVKGACWALGQFASYSLEVRSVNPTKFASRLVLHDGSAARLIIGSARDPAHTVEKPAKLGHCRTLRDQSEKTRLFLPQPCHFLSLRNPASHGCYGLCRGTAVRAADSLVSSCSLFA